MITDLSDPFLTESPVLFYGHACIIVIIIIIIIII